MFSRPTTKAFIASLNTYKTTRRKLYDSGCSRNMLNSTSDFTSLSQNMSEEISLADGSSIYSKGIGTSPIYGKAMYVPDLSRGLISTAQDDLEGLYTLFGNKRVIVTDKQPLLTGNIIRTGSLINSKEYLSDFENISQVVSYNNTDFIYPISLTSNAIAYGANIS